MKRLAGKSDPNPEQVKNWTPDKVIPELLAVKGKQMTKPVPLQEYDVKCALLKAKEILAEEHSFVSVEAPTKIVGDIHGQFSDLVRLLECGGHPPEQKYIFLGDYVDRGNYGIEVVMLLVCYKIAHPTKL